MPPILRLPTRAAVAVGVAALTYALPAGLAGAEEAQVAQQRYLVTFADGARPADVAAARAEVGRAGGGVAQLYRRGFLADLPPAALRALRSSPAVLAVEPDRPLRQGP